MSTKVKCLLLDDELPGLTYLRRLCEEIPNVGVVRAFNDPELFIQSAETLDYNVCIIDIEMPKLNGLEVARQIKNRPIIFTTAYKEYAAEAFDLNAVDYVRKPIQKDRLEKALTKASIIIENHAVKPYAVFNTNKGKTVVLFSEIMHITSSDTDKRDKVVLLENGSRLTLKNIRYDQLLSVLPANKFCRVNKKDVVALTAISFYSYEEVVTKLFTKDKKVIKLPLNDTYRSEFKAKFT